MCSLTLESVRKEGLRITFKPFDLDVLLVRVKVALQRAEAVGFHPEGPPILVLGHLTVDPGIRADIEFMDEATPLSYERYTGSWMESTCGWLLTKETLPMMILGVSKTLPGLNNFYLAGHWVEPGGTVTMATA